MNNLQKFTTAAEYSAATHSYPNVSWITSGDTMIYTKTKPSTLEPDRIRATYITTVPNQEISLYYKPSGSGSGSGSGGRFFTPSQMFIDGVEVSCNNIYSFPTAGEHIVEFKTSYAKTGEQIFSNNPNIISCEIGSGFTSIDNFAFSNCSSLTSVTCYSKTAPSLSPSAFFDVKTNGTLYVPYGSIGYDTWMQNGNYFLGLYDWIKVEL